MTSAYAAAARPDEATVFGEENEPELSPAFAILTAATQGRHPSDRSIPVVCPVVDGRSAVFGLMEGREARRAAESVSRIAAEDVVPRALSRLAPAPGQRPAQPSTVLRLLRGTLPALAGAARMKPARRSPSLVLAAVVEDRFTLAVRGDCRAYLLRDGVLRLLTPRAARKGLSALVGGRSADEVAFLPEPGDAAGYFAAPGDVLFLCGPGIPAVLSDSEIARYLTASRTPTIALRRLLDEARRHGCDDDLAIAAASFGPWIGLLAPAYAGSSSPPRGSVRPGVPVRSRYVGGIAAALTMTMLAAYGWARLGNRPKPTIANTGTATVGHTRLPTPSSPRTGDAKPPAQATAVPSPTRPTRQPSTVKVASRPAKPAGVRPKRVRAAMIVAPAAPRPAVRTQRRVAKVQVIPKKTRRVASTTVKQRRSTLATAGVRRVTSAPRRVAAVSPPRRTHAVPPSRIARAQTASAMGGIPASRR